MLNHRGVALVFGVAIVMSIFPGSASGDAARQDLKTDHLLAKPDLLSAFVAAYEAHKDRFKAEGKTLDAKSLRESSWAVYIVKEEDGNFLVAFGSPTPQHRGGSVEYLVDGKSFEVVDQRIGR